MPNTKQTPRNPVRPSVAFPPPTIDLIPLSSVQIAAASMQTTSATTTATTSSTVSTGKTDISERTVSPTVQPTTTDEPETLLEIKIKGPKAFTCLRCGSAYQNRSSLVRHVAATHEVDITGVPLTKDQIERARQSSKHKSVTTRRRKAKSPRNSSPETTSSSSEGRKSPRRNRVDLAEDLIISSEEESRGPTPVQDEPAAQCEPLDASTTIELGKRGKGTTSPPPTAPKRKKTARFEEVERIAATACRRMAKPVRPKKDQPTEPTDATEGRRPTRPSPVYAPPRSETRSTAPSTITSGEPSVSTSVAPTDPSVHSVAASAVRTIYECVPSVAVFYEVWFHPNARAIDIANRMSNLHGWSSAERDEMTRRLQEAQHLMSMFITAQHNLIPTVRSPAAIDAYFAMLDSEAEAAQNRLYPE